MIGTTACPLDCYDACRIVLDESGVIKGDKTHPGGFNEGENVKVSSKVGETTFIVKYDERLRYDCALIYAGTPNVNMLTPSLLSHEGNSAVYQEYKITISAL
jgi:predicted molibdopterin-dependent oxidoreductase YjgC